MTAAHIAVGLEHSCALLADQTVTCWGSHQHGNLGSTLAEPLALTPLAVPSLSAVVQLATGAGMHTCARLASGSIACWGLNDHGQVGCAPERPVVTTPSLVAGISGAIDVAVGASHSCAVLLDGAVQCWGNNAQGELGDATTTDRFSPGKVHQVSGAVRVALGDRHGCALLRDQTVRCWGSNMWGESGSPAHSSHRTSTGMLKVGSQVTTALSVESVAHAQQIALGAGRSCARIEDGTVVCWGATSFDPKPKAVKGLEAVSSIAVAGHHLCAVLQNGVVSCLGDNGFGQLGDGTRRARTRPAAVSGMSQVVQLAVGREHACAKRQDGSVWCWGSNGAGKLGDGTREWRMSPTLVQW